MSDFRKIGTTRRFPALCFSDIFGLFARGRCPFCCTRNFIKLSSSSRRILYVVPTLDQSGAEKQLTLLATGLAAEGHETQVVALNRGGFFEEQLKAAGIPVTVLNKRLRVDPVTHGRLRQVIRRFRPDIVHSWLFSANTHVRMLHSRRSPWKCVVAERCVDSWKASWQLFLDRRLKTSMDAMVVNSESVAEFYRDLGVSDSRIRVIRNGVARADSTPADDSSRSEWRKKFAIPEGAFVVGSIGRLARQKRLESLLWALHLANMAETDVHGVFAGVGPEWEHLLELSEKYDITHCSKFLGHQENSDEFLAGIDAFWLGSEFEGQSNSLMEAMAAGLPVIVSDIPANLELVTHDETGIVVPLGDSAAFATAVRELKSNPELAARLGAAARKKMLDEFSVQAMIDQHRSLYDDLLAGAPAS